MIMCGLLIVLIVLTIVAGVITFTGWLASNDDALFVGIICLILIGLLGWAMLGNLVPVSSTTEKVTASVFYETNAAYCTKDGKVLMTITDLASFHLLAQRAKVILQKDTHYNMYGIALQDAYSIVRFEE